MKRLFRSLFILRVVFQYGLDQLLLELAPVPWLKLLGKILSVGRRQTDSPGKRIRLALESLGPIFVKFGQVLSTRRDLLPTDIADELALLQDKVPPFDAQLAIHRQKMPNAGSIKSIPLLGIKCFATADHERLDHRHSAIHVLRAG